MLSQNWQFLTPMEAKQKLFSCVNVNSKNGFDCLKLI
jgi:hypothetical protein